MNTEFAPRHGGDLGFALRNYGGNAKDWLDLSTGISPWAYPFTELNSEVGRQLPGSARKLILAARDYYQCGQQKIVPVPGSQLAIRIMPTFLDRPVRVAIPTLGYQEHAYAWARAGHEVVRFQTVNELQQLVKQKQVNSAVVINPNNPTGEIIDAEILRNISGYLDGVLIVDEAFADVDNAQSLCRFNNLNNVIILRSIGKFFGLAGARIGFVIGDYAINERIDALLSPWSINAWGQAIAEKAMTDFTWQNQQLARISQQGQEMTRILSQILGDQFTQYGQGLFSTIIGEHNDISRLHESLAKKQVWTRLGDAYSSSRSDIANSKLQNWLRLSLPGAQFDVLKSRLDDLAPYHII